MDEGKGRKWRNLICSTTDVLPRFEERERESERRREKGRYELPLFLSLQTFGRSLFSSSNFFTTICWWKSYVAVLFSSWHFLSWFSPSLFFLLSLSPDVFDSFTTLSSFLFSSLSCCCCWDEKIVSKENFINVISEGSRQENENFLYLLVYTTSLLCREEHEAKRKTRNQEGRKERKKMKTQSLFFRRRIRHAVDEDNSRVRERKTRIEFVERKDATEVIQLVSLFLFLSLQSTSQRSLWRETTKQHKRRKKWNRQKEKRLKSFSALTFSPHQLLYSLSLSSQTLILISFWNVMTWSSQVVSQCFFLSSLSSFLLILFVVLSASLVAFISFSLCTFFQYQSQRWKRLQKDNPTTKHEARHESSVMQEVNNSFSLKKPVNDIPFLHLLLVFFFSSSSPLLLPSDTLYGYAWRESKESKKVLLCVSLREVNLYHHQLLNRLLLVSSITSFLMNLLCF